MPVHQWFSTGALTVFDWHCPGDDPGVGAEEQAPLWELSIGRTGSHAVRTAAGEHVVEPAHALCLNAGEVFRPVRRILGLDRRTCISLTAAALRELLPERDGEAAPSFSRHALLLSPHLVLVHHRLLRHVAAAERDELAIHALALELAAFTLGLPPGSPASSSSATRSSPRSPRSPRSSPRPFLPPGPPGPPGPPRPRPVSPSLRAAIHAVQEQLILRFAEPLTLAALAASVELSPWHLSRAFSAQLGVGLHHYRTRLRLLAAIERLRDTRRPDLARLAFEVGFSSHSHFTREFRAFFGTPPSRLA